MTMKFKILESNKKELFLRDAKPVIKFIRDNCKPYLKMKGSKPLYRGIAGSEDKYIFIGTVRKRRWPKDTEEEMHKLFNRAFKSVFGWSCRGEGLFVTSDIDQTVEYGEPFAIFPIGNFEFVYSDKIEDLYDFRYLQGVDFLDKLNSPILKKYKNKWEYEITHYERQKMLKKYPEIMEEFVKKYYSNKNFPKAGNTGHEIMIKCDKYVAISNDLDMWDEIEEFFFGKDMSL
jgi:hypothetical protein